MAGTIQEAAERETRELEYLRLTLENARANAEHALAICKETTWEAENWKVARTRTYASLAMRNLDVALKDLPVRGGAL